MTNRLVVAYFGDHDSMIELAALVDTPETMVIAVALDVGQGALLGELRDSALASGAARCHALDVREDFVREVLIPSARSGFATEPEARLGALASAFVTRTLREVAKIEHATAVPVASGRTWRRPVRPRTTGPACLDLRFEDGEPVALNEIPMAAGELAESLEIISGVSAVDVLQLAYRELGDLREGCVMLRTGDGLRAVASEVVDR